VTEQNKGACVTALTGFEIRRRLVGLVWLLALLAGGYAYAHLSSRLSQSFDIPGTRSDTPETAIVARYHTGGTGTPLIGVIRLPAGRSVRQPATLADLAAGFSAAGRAVTKNGVSARVVSYASQQSPALTPGASPDAGQPESAVGTP
jgi:hypothetical protein